MKKLLLNIAIVGIPFIQTLGCPVCERNQPKLLRGIVHGPGPNGNLDYIIVGLVTIVSLIALYLSIKCLTKPGEEQVNHIKRFIINTKDHD